MQQPCVPLVVCLIPLNEAGPRSFQNQPLASGSLEPKRTQISVSAVYQAAMYRYRLIDEQTGADLGPFVSQRPVFAPGERIARVDGERYFVIKMVEPENENFRAYVVVRRQAD